MVYPERFGERLRLPCKSTQRLSASGQKGSSAQSPTLACLIPFVPFTQSAARGSASDLASTRGGPATFDVAPRADRQRPAANHP